MKKLFFGLLSLSLLIFLVSFKEKSKIRSLSDQSLFLSQCNDLSALGLTLGESLIIKNIILNELDEETKDAYLNQRQPSWYIWSPLIDIEICPGSGQPCKLGKALADQESEFSGMTKGKNKGDLLYIFADGTTI